MNDLFKNNVKRKKKLIKKIISQRALLLMLLPGVIFYIVYLYAPIFTGVIVSIKDYSTKAGILGSKFADPWFKNFKFFFNSPAFIPLLKNTFIISFSKLILGIPLAIVLAILLNECRSLKLKRAVQTLTYMPHFLSWVVIYGMCFILFSETNGLINDWIRSLTGSSIPVLTNPSMFRTMIIGTDIWKTTGWSAIIYLAAISGIDPQLYEAAHLDGCSHFKSIIYITLPSISSIIIITMILRCGTILNAGFDQIYVMYNEGVYSTVDIIDTWVFRTGFENFNLSLSSAVGLFKSVISFTLIFIVNKISNHYRGESLW
ncbi:MAG: sugar ABC transporter permease [Lachnospiraceae bacterium]|nr:sugar ABC transporter permease [Lachnospiraceae bacterium]